MVARAGVGIHLLRSFSAPAPPQGQGALGLVWSLVKPAFPSRGSQPVRRSEGGKDPMRSAELRDQVILYRSEEIAEPSTKICSDIPPVSC
jgi:hypothetical protein